MIAQRTVRAVTSRPLVRIGLLLLLPLLRALPLTAQEIDYSVANEFRYGIGEQFQNETAERKEYLENLLNARIFVGNFRLGFRAQLDRPRQFGPDTVGITPGRISIARYGSPNAPGTRRMSARPIRCSVGDEAGRRRPAIVTSSIFGGATG